MHGQEEPMHRTSPGLRSSGTSLELRVSPDVLVMDGVSQSTLTITSADANGKIEPNAAVRVEVTAGGQIVDVLGRLSTKNVTTGATAARLAHLHRAEQRSEPEQRLGERRRHAAVTPGGSDYRNAFSRQVDIRLVPQGTVLPVAYAPVAKFTMSPTAPGEDQNVTSTRRRRSRRACRIRPRRTTSRSARRPWEPSRPISGTSATARRQRPRVTITYPTRGSYSRDPRRDQRPRLSNTMSSRRRRGHRQPDG
jgi:hypothetical protein